MDPYGGRNFFDEEVTSTIGNTEATALKLGDHLCEVSAQLEKTIQNVMREKDITNKRIDGLVEYQTQIETDLLSCENVYCRRMEWEVLDAKKLLMGARRVILAEFASMPAQHDAAGSTALSLKRNLKQSFWSPPFAMSGIRNIQIEMAVIFNVRTNKSSTDGGEMIKIGEVFLYVWCPIHTTIKFRLYFNGHCRNFQHKFCKKQKEPFGGTGVRTLKGG